MSKENGKKREGELKGSCLWGILLFFVLILIDMVTKIAADEYFSRAGAPEEVSIIPGWISLRITYNRGIAYGVGDDAATWLKLLVIGGTAAMMFVLSIVYFRLDKSRPWIRTALVFIVAGGVGNLIDRVYYRVWDPTTLYGVRDMVDLSRFGFAVCNFADFFITGGAVALVVALLFFDQDAVFPMGKYKALAKEAEEAREKKDAEKKAQKEAKASQGEGEQNG